VRLSGSHVGMNGGCSATIVTSGTDVPRPRASAWLLQMRERCSGISASIPAQRWSNKTRTAIVRRGRADAVDGVIAGIQIFESERSDHGHLRHPRAPEVGALHSYVDIAKALRTLNGQLKELSSKVPSGVGLP
jgi:hypothetical protein